MGQAARVRQNASELQTVTRSRGLDLAATGDDEHRKPAAPVVTSFGAAAPTRLPLPLQAPVDPEQKLSGSVDQPVTRPVVRGSGRERRVGCLESLSGTGTRAVQALPVDAKRR
jgi:hypothetical protein